MSDLDRFELFAEVAQLGGITVAAKALGVSKALLSQQIKRLEQQFQITLFNRHKQRLTLTPAGELLLTQCLKLKRELDNARNLLCGGLHDKPKGNLHVVVFPYFAEQLIFPKLKAFLASYPELSLQIDTTERVPDFMDEKIDLSIGFSLPVPNPAEVIQKRMVSTNYLLCGSPGYFKQKGIPKTLNELYQHQYIEHSSRIGCSLKLKSDHSLLLKPHLVLNTVRSMIECARRGAGLIQLPCYMVNELTEQNQLLAVLTEYQATDASVYYHYPKLNYMQPKVRKFIDFFL